ncbi:ATP-binding protein [Clostridium saccharoperbutylacetonicum]
MGDEFDYLNDKFDFSKAKESYKCEDEYIDDLLKMLSVYFQVANDMKSKFSTENIFDYHLSGICVNESDIYNYINTFSLFDKDVQEDLKNNMFKIEEYINSRVINTKKEGRILRIESLKESFKLSKFEFFAVICSLSCNMDMGFQGMIYLFHNIDGLWHPTFGVVRALYKIFNPLSSDKYIEYFCNDSILNKYFFIKDDEFSENSLVNHSMILNRRILDYIYNKSDNTKEFKDVTEKFCCDEEVEKIIAYEDNYNKIFDTYNYLKERQEKCLIWLHGENGTGKKLALRKLAKEKKLKIIFLDISKLMDYDKEKEEKLVMELELECILEGAIIVIENIVDDKEKEDEEEKDKYKLQNIIESLFKFSNIIFTKSEIDNITYVNNYFSFIKIKYEYPSYSQSVALWEGLSEGYLLKEDIDFKIISCTHILTPLQIKCSLKNAEILRCIKKEEKITLNTLTKEIFLTCTNNLSKLAQKIKSDYTWEDLIIEESQKEILSSFCNRIKYGREVNERWSKGNKLSYGMGTSLLLCGAPGTGKTMSAHVIANELNLELYRVDLSQIINKYIGETSKNIDKIFKEAENNNIILFFDEADALFSKRNEVKDSIDKYANADTGHLLQKIEDYKGVSILATNLYGNIDEAFKRRINYIVNIKNPDINERLNLWKNIFPPKSSLASDIDYEYLAENFELSGSSIKSIALQADLFASETKEEICMSHILKAIKFDYVKKEKIIPRNIIEYYDM